MTKKELLKLLDDPEVIERLKEIVLMKRKVIPKHELRKVTKLVNWWSNEINVKLELTEYQKEDILQAINKRGENLVLVLQKAIKSPLRTDGSSFMAKYLNDLLWCIKDANFTKLADGRYDKKNSNTPQAFKSTNEEDDLNNKLLRKWK